MLVSLSLLALAQTELPPLPPGADAGFFGRSVVLLDDLDGDDVRDFAVSAPRYGSGYPGPAGCVFVVSGKTSKVIGSWRPTPEDLLAGEGDRFGKAMTAAGDLDGDGFEDLLIEARGPVLAFAWSAKGGQRLFGLKTGLGGVQPVGDLDRDGCHDLLVTGEDGWRVLSGSDGKWLADVAEAPEGDAILLGDGNGDGLADGVSADGRLLFESERTEDGLRYHQSMSGLTEGGRHPERVEAIPGADGVRELLSVDPGGPRVRVHRMGPGRLELLAEASLPGLRPQKWHAPLQVLSLPREGGHDLIIAAKLEQDPFTFGVRRLRTGAAKPLWETPIFYPVTARFTLAHGRSTKDSPQILVGVSATGHSGAFHSDGVVSKVSTTDGKVSYEVREMDTLLDPRFDARTLWTKRLLVFEGGTEACRAQVAALAADPKGLDARKLVVIELLGSAAFERFGTLGIQVPAGLLRRRARLDRKPFHGVLIGLDGGVKHRFTEPISTEELYGLIDRMPMRRKELEGK